MASIYKNPIITKASSNLRIPLAAALRDLGSKCVIPEGYELQSLQELGKIVSELEFAHGLDSVAGKDANAKYIALESLYFDFLKARADAAAAKHKIASANFRAKVREVYGDNYANIPEDQVDSTICKLSEHMGSIFKTLGPDSDEFKKASAMFDNIGPMYRALVCARSKARNTRN